ncbi:MAG: 30S ribosome-binding factor RbfA [Gammaproteobacteria bacterium]
MPPTYDKASAGKKEFSRTKRVAAVIQHELAPLLHAERENIPSKMVTISHITLSRDLQHAKVFITVIEEDQKIIDDTLTVLNQKSSEFRYELAHTVNLRVTPRLWFVYDAALQYSHDLTALINKANPL